MSPIPESHYGRVEALNLPRLSWAAFAGDAAAVRRCLQEGEEIHQTVSLVNQNKQEAAQNGHLDVCRELLNAGADVLRGCSIPATGESFGPTDIALIHFHLRTWWLLNDAKAKRCSKLAGRRSMKHGAHLAQPLIAEGAQLSSGGALMI